tara:strand:- start:871 stop:1311 length:441 start_codon:yes stop_codon:yes gene_type:complete
MPEKVTTEEKLVELAIAKAKKVKMLQEQGVERVENAEPMIGETVKVTRPKAKKDRSREKTQGIRSPAEEKPNTSKLKKGFTPSQHDFRELMGTIYDFLNKNGHKKTAMGKAIASILFDNMEVDEALAIMKVKGDPTQSKDIRYDDS